ncbi:FecR domain-containing protein [Candidatus Woesearchaeota archaeon]|nr:FecR domain-containing protein [Candidatus Woesearchaeota archaeon]
MLKKILGSILFIFILIAGGIAYSLFSSSTEAAQLHIESGTVTVNGNTVTNDQTLSSKDVIETTNGKATVILHDSIIISLEPNTKITLDSLTRKNPVVSQPTGTTWNTFMKLTGVDGFDIKTSNSIASVRGTGFQLTDKKVLTADGTVTYNDAGKTFTVTEMTAVEQGLQRPANNEEKTSVKNYYRQTVNELKRMRKTEMNKHQFLMRMIKTQYGMSDDMINKKMDEIDTGTINVDDIMRQAPVTPASLNKLAMMTKEIQNLNQKLARM